LSSPLGQLFDHGCDTAVSSPAIGLVFVQALSLGNSLDSLIIVMASIIVLLLAAWEEKYTH